MQTKIVAFGASSSKKSINKRLATYTAQLVPNASVNLLDLNDYEMPIYSIDREKENGIHPLAVQFKQQLLEADGIIISFAEHNGAYTAAFKNIFEWISRIGPNVWGNKPMFLLATSPGARGAQTVLEIAFNKLKRMNESPILSFSFPSFHENFDGELGIKDAALKATHEELLQQFIENIAAQN